MTEPLPPSAIDTNSPVRNDSEKDANELSMTEPSTATAIQECIERIEASNGALLVYLNAGHKAAREAASMLAKKTIRLNKRALSSLPTL